MNAKLGMIMDKLFTDCFENSLTWKRPFQNLGLMFYFMFSVYGIFKGITYKQEFGEKHSYFWWNWQISIILNTNNWKQTDNWHCSLKKKKNLYIPKEATHRMQLKLPPQHFRLTIKNFHNTWNKEKIQRISKKEKHGSYRGFEVKLATNFSTTAERQWSNGF